MLLPAPGRPKGGSSRIVGKDTRTKEGRHGPRETREASRRGRSSTPSAKKRRKELWGRDNGNVKGEGSKGGAKDARLVTELPRIGRTGRDLGGNIARKGSRRKGEGKSELETAPPSDECTGRRTYGIQLVSPPLFIF